MKDKFQHFIVCASAVIICGWLAYKYFGQLYQIVGLTIGSVIALTWGYWKERTDAKFDWWDIIADIAGVTFGWWVT